MEGINSRMDGLQGAVLSVKLPHLQAWTDARRKVAARYDELLREISAVTTPAIAANRDHVYHLYVIRTDERDALRKHLSGSGIDTVLNYPKALPFYPAYAYLAHQPSDFPVAYANQSRILSLPIYPEMSESAIGFVSEKIAEFFSGAGRIAQASRQLVA
jgi:dTDP-4-amino-4,6-dideoxygalactose transaminase